MAINGSRSDFTSENEYILDTFKEMFELDADDIANVQEYKRLKSEGELTEETLKSLGLSNKIITSEDWNLLLDAMYNLQKAYKDKGLYQIQTTVEDYIQSYTEEQKLSQTINEKIGTTIDSLLLTNATQVIISTTQPAVVDGALWIKPKS